ncbi:synaptogyrin-3-like protein [Lates japonicus]|uniref:Synaptogyrin-3-like protein n=1 Tax=Lates japonicus TaxID=270547 RepID=A0AAD3MVK7_LATJO|nr:synaptogyrin-3-like protein [Lates japonicus]
MCDLAPFSYIARPTAAGNWHPSCRGARAWAARRTERERERRQKDGRSGIIRAGPGQSTIDPITFAKQPQTILKCCPWAGQTVRAVQKYLLGTDDPIQSGAHGWRAHHPTIPLQLTGGTTRPQKPTRATLHKVL